MIGVEIVENKNTKIPDKNKVNKILDKCKENGLLLVSCGQEGNVIRFMGPLTTPQNQVEEAMEIFNNSLI
jgi:4-aminobutyrate aminotransferase/(S)-3-amino-2-methylpropionate transaminase